MGIVWDNTPTEFDKSVTINIDALYESYEKKDIDDIYNKITAVQMQDFAEDLKEVRKFKTIKLPSSIHDISVELLTQKYYDVRNAINACLNIKSKFIDYKRNWKEIEMIIKNVHAIKRNELMITDDIKEMKNQGLRDADIEYRLRNLVSSAKKVDIVMLRIKFFEDELQETLLYLQDVKNDMSRLQSAIALALDTGEMPRTYWKKSEGN